MFLVDDIWDEGRGIIGKCDDTTFFRWCGDVVTMIANKGDFEGWKMTLDICTTGCGNCKEGPVPSHCNRNDCGNRIISLPREVDTVIALNVGGQPTLGFTQLFNFHLNGPGDCKHTCDWSWYDMGKFYPTMRDLVTPAQLVVYLDTPEDNGKKFIVYGYDQNGRVLRRQVAGQWVDGYQVPTVFGYAIPDVDAPFVARITWISKDPSVGSMRLSTTDGSGLTGVTLGLYEPDETLPQYRRVRLNRCCSWVRVACLKTTPTFKSKFDHIPLQSRMGFLLGMQARKFYKDLQTADAHSYEADAARLEVEAQMKLEAPLYAPIQIIDRAGQLRDKSDYWMG